MAQEKWDQSYREKNQGAGLVKVAVWIPAGRRVELKALAGEWRKAARAEAGVNKGTPEDLIS